MDKLRDASVVNFNEEETVASEVVLNRSDKFQSVEVNIDVENTLKVCICHRLVHQDILK